MLKKEIRKFIEDAKKQEKNIHPRWIYWLLLDLWALYKKKNKNQKSNQNQKKY